MGAQRAIVQDSGLSRNSRAGDALSFKDMLESVIATDANLTLLWGDCAGGVVRFSSFSAGRNVTTDTAVNILAANAALDVGDAIMFVVSCQAAFAATWVAGAGVTLAGRATTPASTYSLVLVRKTGAATVTWTIL